MYITMDEKTHTYFVDGQIADISVTELLHKHGLAPNYDGVDEEVLNAARERGKSVHADIEKYIMADGYIPETREGLAFAHWAEMKTEWALAEQKLAIEWKGKFIACTADLLAVLALEKGPSVSVIADHKTTSRFQREYVSWQVSIYDFIARHIGRQMINDKVFYWQGAEKFLCFLYDKEGKMEVKECDKIPDSEIERLLECELKGERYTRRELVLPDEMGLELNAAEETLVFYEKAYKAAKERSDKARAALTAEMERQGVFNYESDRLKVSYRAASESVIVDSTRLKKEQPKLFAEYSKISKRKATVIISVKGEEQNGEVQEN